MTAARFWLRFQVDRSSSLRRGWSLETRVGLVLTGLAAVLLMLAAGLWLHTTRLAIHEEVEAASRVSRQWLRVALVAPDGLPVVEHEARLLTVAREIGRVRANELQIHTADGAPVYISPAPTYKAGRTAPAWFAALLASDTPVHRQTVGDLRLSLIADPSRAQLDAWDDLLAMAGWALTALLLLFVACRQALARALRPLEQVMQALDRTGSGRFDTRLPVFASPELGRLAHAFNSMADRLRAAVNDNVRLETERELAECLHQRLSSERREIARELHDELAQGITAVRALAGAIVQRSGEQPALLAPAQGIVAVTGEMQDGVRNILYRLRPQAGEALAGRLHALLDNWQRQHEAVRIERSIAPDISPMPDAVAQAVIRIVQEGLTNVARHAAATRVTFRLQVAGERLQLRLRDNGKAASGHSTTGNAGCGLGLAGIRERVAALAGCVEAGRCDDGGYVLDVALPLNSQPLEHQRAETEQ